MSKGINIFKHFKKLKKEPEHKIIMTNPDLIVWCGVSKDYVTGLPTSNGVMCGHCKEHI